MNRSLILATCLFLTLATDNANARNTINKFSIAEFMANTEYSSRLEGVKFYFGDQEHPEIIQNYGEFRTNKKTNAFNKKDKPACEWVMLSAMLALHSRAQSLGANAVVNIQSNYKNNVESSETEYTCGAGGLMAGAALIGTFISIDIEAPPVAYAQPAVEAAKPAEEPTEQSEEASSDVSLEN